MYFSISALVGSLENLIEDIGYKGLNSSLLESHVDGYIVAEYLEDDIRNMIYEDPDGYDIIKLPSKSQYEEIWI